MGSEVKEIQETLEETKELDFADAKAKFDELLRQKMKDSIHFEEDLSVMVRPSSYDDRIPDHWLKEAVTAGGMRSMDYLNSKMNEMINDNWYQYDVDYAIDAAELLVTDEMRGLLAGFEVDGYTVRDGVKDLVMEEVYPTYDLKEWDKEICVDLFLDNGESDSGFIANNPFYCDEGAMKNTSLYWFAKQQDCLDDYLAMVKAYKNDEPYECKSKVTESIREELLNESDYAGRLTVCVRMNALDYLDLIDKLKYDRNFDQKLIVPKNTTIGLYEPMNGAGGTLEIETVKDIEIPSRILFDAVLDLNERTYYSPLHYDQYSIHECYGVMDSLWDGTVTIKDFEEPEHERRTYLQEEDVMKKCGKLQREINTDYDNPKTVHRILADDKEVYYAFEYKKEHIADIYNTYGEHLHSYKTDPNRTFQDNLNEILGTEQLEEIGKDRIKEVEIRKMMGHVKDNLMNYYTSKLQYEDFEVRYNSRNQIMVVENKNDDLVDFSCKKCPKEVWEDEDRRLDTVKEIVHSLSKDQSLQGKLEKMKAKMDENRSVEVASPPSKCEGR